MILSLGTRAQTGKDSAAQYLIAKKGFRRLAFADALKTDVHLMLQEIDLDYNEDNKALYRPLLIAYGELRRNLQPDYWLDIVVKTLKENPQTNWIITDMRYPNEAQVLKDLGAVLIRINRTTNLDIPSEAIGDEISVDYEVDNNGTFEELHRQLDQILAKDTKSVVKKLLELPRSEENNQLIWACAWCNPSHQGESTNTTHGLCKSHEIQLIAQLKDKK